MILAVLSHAAWAQATNGPAELPPASFTGQQYVDSTGCAFVRAGLDGVNTWVPRLTRDRTPLCGFAPTLAQVSAPVEAPQPQPVAAAIEPPRRAAEGAPIATVAGAMATTAPARVAAPASPQIIAAPAPVAVAVQPRTMTLAQACAGRTGIQPNMRSASTGQPIDCGPGTAVAVAAPVATGCQSTIDAYFTGGTGVAPQCGPGLGAARIALPAADPTVPRGMNGGTGYGLVAPAGAVVARSTHAPAQDPLGLRAPVPASNPVNAPEVTAPPPGYRDVWTDGRINPDRGLPPGTTIIRAGEAAPHVAARAVAPEATGDRFVQVGMFGQPANAQAAIARLQSLGLPVGTARVTRNGAELQIVLAGPFADAGALAAALQSARGAGFGDAFTRQ